MKQSIVLLFLFVIGCAVEPKIPTGQLGSVSGHAVLYNSAGIPLPSSKNITVIETASGKSTQTDSTGKWIINALPEGEHTFTLTREGFGMMKIFNFSSKGKDTTCEDEMDLSQKVTDRLNFQRFDVEVQPIDSSIDYLVTGAMQPPFLKIRSVVLCIGTDSAALAQDPGSAPVLLPFVTGGSGYDGAFGWGSTSAFSAAEKSFTQGTTIYATLAITGEGPDAAYLSNYFDPTLGRQVFTALGNHSQIISKIIP